MKSPPYIYIYGDSIGLASGRDEIEDAIDEHTQEYAEVTGGGAGASGWNIDIEILDNEKRGFIVRQIARTLMDFRLPWDTVLDIDGTTFDFRCIYREAGLEDEPPESNG